MRNSKKTKNRGWGSDVISYMHEVEGRHTSYGVIKRWSKKKVPQHEPKEFWECNIGASWIIGGWKDEPNHESSNQDTKPNGKGRLCNLKKAYSRVVVAIDK